MSVNLASLDEVITKIKLENPPLLSDLPEDKVKKIIEYIYYWVAELSQPTWWDE